MYKMIPEFSEYEINEDGVVRRKKDGFKPNIRKNGTISLRLAEKGFRSVYVAKLLRSVFDIPDFIENMKQIGFPQYSITCDGKIWSHARNHWLSTVLIGHGYNSCRLHSNTNKPKTVLVHRLVALMFIPNPENKPTVNHIDGNKLNNCVLNLEWATYLENNRHAVINNLRNTIIHPKQIRKICKFISQHKNYTTQKIADTFKVSWGTIANIRNREAWIHISNKYVW